VRNGNTNGEGRHLIATSDLGGGIRLITLDNPPVNALSIVLCGQLIGAVEAAESDASVSTVIFSGANRVFSGGADVKDFDTLLSAFTSGERPNGTKTYVAAIDGNALGGGFELALASDYRVATPSSRVGLPEIKLGLLPGAGGTQRLPRLIGANDALQFMLKGDAVKAPEAKAKGLLDEVVDGDPVEAAKAFAGKPRRRIAGSGCSRRRSWSRKHTRWCPPKTMAASPRTN
jgi:3-hydroxyacyl-CoA dehydrogenase